MLALRHITRRFGTLTALDDVSVEFEPGRVHGVLGENGAGKTTLMRVAAGLCRPDAGEILIENSSLPPGSAVAAQRAGIAMVHQHFMLVPTLTVAENCLLGRRDLPQWFTRIHVPDRLRELASRIGLDVQPDQRVESLSVGQRQRVEILRALFPSPKVLILDEPTAVLTPQETEQFFHAVDRLREEGLAIVFISHKLAEVERLCDTLTILRHGRCVYQGPADELTRNEMAARMVGEDIPGDVRLRDRESAGELVFTMDHVDAEDRATGRRIVDVSLDVRGGEILGIAGVEGNGQDVFAALIMGLLPTSSGQLRLNGNPIDHLSTAVRTRAGIAHIAEDRTHQALVPDMTLRENMILKTYTAGRFSRAGLLSRRAIAAYADDKLDRFDVRAASPESPARDLSGGNQQKLVLARELSSEPHLILAHNPVRGLDVAATRFVFDRLREQRHRGAAILLMHSDLDELLEVADRVAVLYGGRVWMTSWPQTDRAEIGRLMMGVEK